MLSYSDSLRWEDVGVEGQVNNTIDINTGGCLFPVSSENQCFLCLNNMVVT